MGISRNRRQVSSNDDQPQVLERHRLPVVDPDILMDDDPEALDDYARGLLLHVKSIRDGKPSRGYSINKIKAATVWLIGAYDDAQRKHPREMKRLIVEIIRPRPGTRHPSPAQDRKHYDYWKALRYEAENPKKSLYQIAKHVRTNPETGRILDRSASQDTVEKEVRRWQRRDHYQRHVTIYRGRALRR